MLFQRRPLNLIIFIALMGSSAIALATKLFFINFFPAALLAYLIETGVVLAFTYYLIYFISHLVRKNEFIENLTNPLKANLYSSIPIASALISLMLVKIGLPWIDPLNLTLAVLFWLISLFLSLIFIIIVPINLKFRSNVEQVSGTWFLPPGWLVCVNYGRLNFSSVIAAPGF